MSTYILDAYVHSTHIYTPQDLFWSKSLSKVPPVLYSNLYQSEFYSNFNLNEGRLFFYWRFSVLLMDLKFTILPIMMLYSNLYLDLSLSVGRLHIEWSFYFYSHSSKGLEMALSMINWNANVQSILAQRFIIAQIHM